MRLRAGALLAPKLNSRPHRRCSPAPVCTAPAIALCFGTSCVGHSSSGCDHCALHSACSSSAFGTAERSPPHIQLFFSFSLSHFFFFSKLKNIISFCRQVKPVTSFTLKRGNLMKIFFFRSWQIMDLFAVGNLKTRGKDSWEISLLWDDIILYKKLGRIYRIVGNLP